MDIAIIEKLILLSVIYIFHYLGTVCGSGYSTTTHLLIMNQTLEEIGTVLKYLRNSSVHIMVLVSVIVNDLALTAD